MNKGQNRQEKGTNKDMSTNQWKRDQENGSENIRKSKLPLWEDEQNWDTSIPAVINTQKAPSDKRAIITPILQRRK